jgi:protein involved in polysaccharide export with SLBB domain
MNKAIQSALLVCVILLYVAQPVSADDFRFSKADGFKLLIYDNNVEPEKNRLLATFHNTDYVIDGDGEIQLGAFGKIKMAGLSVEKASDLIYEKLQPFGKEIKIVVLPQIRLVIRGEVGKPGMYRVSPNISFWDLLAQAGGISSSFSLENMYVVRNGEIIYTKFMDALYLGTSLKELGLQSGDELIAPRINRVSFTAIMRYVNLFTSLFFLYYAVTNINAKNN